MKSNTSLLANIMNLNKLAALTMTFCGVKTILIPVLTSIRAKQASPDAILQAGAPSLFPRFKHGQDDWDC